MHEKLHRLLHPQPAMTQTAGMLSQSPCALWDWASRTCCRAQHLVESFTVRVDFLTKRSGIDKFSMAIKIPTSPAAMVPGWTGLPRETSSPQSRALLNVTLGLPHLPTLA
jgi:hypothetical protein